MSKECRQQSSLGNITPWVILARIFAVFGEFINGVEVLHTFAGQLIIHEIKDIYVGISTELFHL